MDEQHGRAWRVVPWDIERRGDASVRRTNFEQHGDAPTGIRRTAGLAYEAKATRFRIGRKAAPACLPTSAPRHTFDRHRGHGISRARSHSSLGCFMRTSSALVLGSTAVALVAIGCGTSQAPAPAPVPAAAAP